MPRANPRRPFEPPGWWEPLALADRLRAIPPGATVRGIFFEGPVVAAWKRSGVRVGRDSYGALTPYPLAEHVQVLVSAAMVGFPDVPVREGLRRLGRDAFHAFLSSGPGRALFAVAGRTFEGGLGLVSKAYALAGPVGTATVSRRSPRESVIRLKDIYNFPDCYHVGVFEAALDHYGKRGTVRIRARSVSDVELQLELS